MAPAPAPPRKDRARSLRRPASGRWTCTSKCTLRRACRLVRARAGTVSGVHAPELPRRLRRGDVQHRSDAVPRGGGRPHAHPGLPVEQGLVYARDRPGGLPQSGRAGAVGLLLPPLLLLLASASAGTPAPLPPRRRGPPAAPSLWTGEIFAAPVPPSLSDGGSVPALRVQRRAGTLWRSCTAVGLLAGARGGMQRSRTQSFLHTCRRVTVDPELSCNVAAEPSSFCPQCRELNVFTLPPPPPGSALWPRQEVAGVQSTRQMLQNQTFWANGLRGEFEKYKLLDRPVTYGNGHQVFSSTAVSARAPRPCPPRAPVTRSAPPPCSLPHRVAAGVRRQMERACRPPPDGAGGSGGRDPGDTPPTGVHPWQPLLVTRRRRWGARRGRGCGPAQWDGHPWSRLEPLGVNDQLLGLYTRYDYVRLGRI